MTGRFNTFRAAIATTIKAAMPSLRECQAQLGRFDLDELQRGSIRAPGIRVGVLTARLQANPNDTSTADCECAAFAVAEGKDSDEKAWNMAEAVAELLRRKQRFGLEDIGVPTDLRIGAVLAGTFRSKGVSVVAVEWKQRLHAIGEGIVFSDDDVVWEQLYINDELVIDEPAEGGE